MGFSNKCCVALVLEPSKLPKVFFLKFLGKYQYQYFQSGKYSPNKDIIIIFTQQIELDILCKSLFVCVEEGCIKHKMHMNHTISVKPPASHGDKVSPQNTRQTSSSTICSISVHHPYIGLIGIDWRQFIFHFEARFCVMFISCRWTHLGQEALGCSDTCDGWDVDGDAYYDVYND